MAPGRCRRGDDLRWHPGRVHPGTRGGDPTSRHAEGCDADGDRRRRSPPAVKAARKADLVVLVVGEPWTMSGEATSRSSLGLPGRQEDLVRAVVAAGTPVVVVLMNGRAITDRLGMRSAFPRSSEAGSLGSKGGGGDCRRPLRRHQPGRQAPDHVPPDAVGRDPLALRPPRTPAAPGGDRMTSTRRSTSISP